MLDDAHTPRRGRELLKFRVRRAHQYDSWVPRTDELRAYVLMACMLGGCAFASAQEDAVRSYERLPESVRKLVLTGEPRSSDDIPDSPFGTGTTVCNEGGPPEYLAGVADAIAAAGYKWAGEYVYANWRAPVPTSAEEFTRRSSIPKRCTDYIAQLRARGIHVLMRLDPLPNAKLIGRQPITEQELAYAVAYTRSVVSQLKASVQDWQIGNEPNTSETPEPYARIAQALARAVRAEQPNAVLYGPGVAMLQCLGEQPFPWLRRVFAADVLKSFDVFSFHPYRANGDLPENASEFARWRYWPSYDGQLDALRKMLQLHPRRHKGPMRLAVTEDGEASPFSASGEQRITAIIDAKNELRRALLDFAQNMYPRIHFVFFRGIPDAAYSYEGSFNTVNAALDKKPLYFAAQNLHAVLDSSYKPSPDAHVKLNSDQALARSFIKHHPTFDELLVFFWSRVPARDVHVRSALQLEVKGRQWEAPLLIDLMTMPASGGSASKHQRTSYPAARRTREGVAIDAELRDYPQLLKLVRETHPQSSLSLK